MSFLYLFLLVFSLGGMVVLDRKFVLFFYQNFRLAATVLLLGVSFFLLWDLFGIALGIFFQGENQFMTGVLLSRELPLEELFFLVLLCYVSMNIFSAVYRYFVARDAREKEKS